MIHMQENLNSINFVCSKIRNFDELIKLPALEPFNDSVCDFLNDLSNKILKDPEAKMFSDVITFGFFCRKANLNKLKRKFNIENRLGRGVTFHIAPSNVPVNFAYSMISALLSGNIAIVRASSKDFTQTRIICRLMEECDSKILKYISIIMYNHDKNITDYLSRIADVRVIWGGDNTINEIRKSSISCRSTEVTFSDRSSIAVIDADSILQLEKIDELIYKFYNDTYLFDQNACTSPRMIFWFGNKDSCRLASIKFWSSVSKMAKSQYDLKDVSIIDKYVNQLSYVINNEKCNIDCSFNNYVSIINISKLNNEYMKYNASGGNYFQYFSDDINELIKLDSKKIQTLSYYGIDNKILSQVVIANGLKGIDRIVPIGNTTDFDLFWDGYDLINCMSRKVCVN